MAPYFSWSNATDYDFTLQKSRVVTTRERRDKALVWFMYLLKWISRIFISPSYFASIMIREPRGLSNAFPFLNTNSVSLGYRWLFTPEKIVKILAIAKTVMQLNTSDVFKPLSKFRSSSFFYTHQASQRNIFIDISTNRNFKFSKVLFILLLSPIPKNPLI